MSCKVYTGATPVESAAWPSIDSAAGLSTSRVRAIVPSGGGASPNVTPEQRAEYEEQAERRIREAHASGVAEGRKAAAAELDAAVQRIARNIDELSRLKARLRKEAEKDMVRLTGAIAQRILRRELTVDPDALQGVVGAALERLQVRDLFQVRTHPSHEKVVRQALASSGAPAISIIPDNSLQLGDVLFDTARGTLDASLDSQLREIERGFADLLTR